MQRRHGRQRTSLDVVPRSIATLAGAKVQEIKIAGKDAAATAYQVDRMEMTLQELGDK